jgi:hypothetical protein
VEFVSDMAHVAGSVRRDLRCVTKNFIAIYNVFFLLSYLKRSQIDIFLIEHPVFQWSLLDLRLVLQCIEDVYIRLYRSIDPCH